MPSRFLPFALLLAGPAAAAQNTPLQAPPGIPVAPSADADYATRYGGPPPAAASVDRSDVQSFVRDELGLTGADAIAESELEGVLDAVEAEFRTLLLDRDVLVTSSLTPQALVGAVTASVNKAGGAGGGFEVTVVDGGVEVPLSRLDPQRRYAVLALIRSGRLPPGMKLPGLTDDPAAARPSLYAPSGSRLSGDRGSPRTPAREAEFRRGLSELVQPGEPFDDRKLLRYVLDNASDTYSNGAPKIDDQGVPVYANGSPKVSRDGTPLYSNGTPRIGPGGRGLHSTGTPLAAADGQPLAADGTPRRATVDLPVDPARYPNGTPRLSPDGLPQYSDGGPKLAKDGQPLYPNGRPKLAAGARPLTLDGREVRGTTADADRTQGVVPILDLVPVTVVSDAEGSVTLRDPTGAERDFDAADLSRIVAAGIDHRPVAGPLRRGQQARAVLRTPVQFVDGTPVGAEGPTRLLALLLPADAAGDTVDGSVIVRTVVPGIIRQIDRESLTVQLPRAGKPLQARFASADARVQNGSGAGLAVAPAATLRPGQQVRLFYRQHRTYEDGRMTDTSTPQLLAVQAGP